MCVTKDPSLCERFQEIREGTADLGPVGRAHFSFIFNGLSLTRVLSDLTSQLSISSATLFQREAGPGVFDQACQPVGTQAMQGSTRSELGGCERSQTFTSLTKQKSFSSGHPNFYLVFLSYLYFYSIWLFMCLLAVFDIVNTALKMDSRWRIETL